MYFVHEQSTRSFIKVRRTDKTGCARDRENQLRCGDKCVMCSGLNAGMKYKLDTRPHRRMVEIM
jgi:hypothetical protein